MKIRRDALEAQSEIKTRVNGNQTSNLQQYPINQ